MNFYTESVLITPCGANIHFKINQIKEITATSQLAFNTKAINPNGEKAKFTHEPGTCKGTHF